MRPKTQIFAPVKDEGNQYTCGECIHVYGQCCRGAKGTMILGYCRYYKNGKWALFLTNKACRNFKAN